MANVMALPTRLNLENYSNAFALMRYPSLFLNTLLVTAVGTGGVVLLASMAGYKLSRTKTRYSWLLFILCVAPMMIPFQSFMIALVKVAKNLHLTNSTSGLSVIYWGLGVPLVPLHVSWLRQDRAQGDGRLRLHRRGRHLSAPSSRSYSRC